MRVTDKVFLMYCIIGFFGLWLVLPAVIWYDSNKSVDPEYEKIMDTVVHIRTTVDHAECYDDYYSTEWQGSGCFVSPDGIIVTARHVIEDADSFIITLRDGREFETKVCLAADNLDVGFIKIDVNDVPYLEFGDDPGLGEKVWIYGHPLGDMNGWSVTGGIVSNLERDCDGFFGEFMMIQSDSAAWPGTSGGPVVDADGKVIGILVGIGVGQECLSYISPGIVCKEWFDVMVEWLECH